MGLLRTIGLCLDLRAAERKTTEQIHLLQQRRLRALIRFAKRRSPFYAERLQQVDLRADPPWLAHVPPLTKSDLMTHFDRIVADPRVRLEDLHQWVQDPDRVGRRFLNRYVVIHTSGTTGDPAFFIYNRREWDWIQALSVTRGVRFKPSFAQFFSGAFRVLRRPVRIALVAALNGHFITHVLFRVVPAVSRFGADFHYLSVLDPIESLSADLNRYQPDLLHGYPTVLEQLAHQQLAGRLSIAPAVLTCSSEPLTPSAFEVIRQAFPDGALHQTYGSSEGVHLANQCQRHTGLHVNADCFLLENVDDSGSAQPLGQAGSKLYLTSLIARSLPLIRYELNDSITVHSQSACSCGLPFPRIAVAGRSDDTFWLKNRNGAWIALPPIPFEALLLNVGGLAQYQLIHHEQNRLHLRYRARVGVQADRLAAQIQSRFDSFFHEHDLNGCIQLNLQHVDRIDRDPRTGKLRQILSLVRPPGEGEGKT